MASRTTTPVAITNGQFMFWANRDANAGADALPEFMRKITEVAHAMRASVYLAGSVNKGVNVPTSDIDVKVRFQGGCVINREQWEEFGKALDNEFYECDVFRKPYIFVIETKTLGSVDVSPCEADFLPDYWEQGPPKVTYTDNEHVKAAIRGIKRHPDFDRKGLDGVDAEKAVCRAEDVGGDDYDSLKLYMEACRELGLEALFVRN